MRTRHKHSVVSVKDSATTDQALEHKPDFSNASFPIESLPPVLKEFVTQCANSLSVHPDLVALPVVVTIGAAIGTARQIKIKEGWCESALLYGAVVAETGTMKTPALEKATAPLIKAQTPERRTWVSDVTVERLAHLLAENERGLLLKRDELSGWVGSLNQYRRGKGGDREFFLSVWSSSPIAVDRQNGTAIHVPHPFLPIVGGLPPDVLPRLQEGYGEDGLSQRMLYAWPTLVPVTWRQDTLSTTVVARYDQLINTLLTLPVDQEQSCQLPLAKKAKRLFVTWHDKFVAEVGPESPIAHMRGYYMKYRAYCGRLALIHALASAPHAKEVTEVSIQAAIQQIDYFKRTALKAADHLCRSVGVGEHKSEIERCREEIRRKVRSGIRERRTLQRNSQFSADIFNKAFTSMSHPELIVTPNSVTFYRSSTDMPTTDKNWLTLKPKETGSVSTSELAVGATKPKRKKNTNGRTKRR
jgi:hypothetical protein